VDLLREDREICPQGASVQRGVRPDGHEPIVPLAVSRPVMPPRFWVASTKPEGALGRAKAA
jgi:hypothetical protein